MARFSAPSITIMTDSGSSDITWTMYLWSVFYEDSGTSRIRIVHKLSANIFATDTVNFEISFRPGNLDAPQDASTIGEDYVQCDMSQSSSDGFFWSASVAEGMYVCAGDDADDVCKYITDDTKYTQNPESTSDWVTPYADDDDTDPWCVHTNTTIDNDLIAYECSELRCIIERDMNTGDTDNDLAFTPVPGTNDSMVIQPGRAKLYINKTLQNHAFAMSNDFNADEVVITVPTGASSLLLFAASATAVALAALAF